MGLQTLLIVGLLLQRARRRQAEENAYSLGRRLITAHEDERSRLGRELHDDVSQRLVRLALDADYAVTRFEGSADEDFARTMREDASRLSEDVHALSYRLHPSVLVDLGLTEALRAECDLFRRHHDVRADLITTDATPRLTSDAALCLFRIVQEALRNVARHAEASRVDVTLSLADRGVKLAVKDDGAGFDAKQDSPQPSLGHASMRERVHLVHGKLSIRSAPRQGTTVTVWVPSARDQVVRQPEQTAPEEEASA